MKKFFASILLVQVFFCLHLKAQSIDELRNKLNYVFQNIDKSQVPTGYLEEYGPGFVPFKPFNGILTDSNRLDMDLWEILYGSIKNSLIYGTSNLPEMEVAMDSVLSKSNIADHVFAVPILLMDYGILSPRAVQFNLFSVSDNQLFDVAERTQSPYLQRTLFAASPLVNGSTTGSVTVLFKNDLFFTNTNKTISSIQIDFNDGAGYSTIALNSPFTKTYTDTGYKRWKMKLTCTDNSVYECYSEFYVLQVVNSLEYNRPPDLDTLFNAVPGLHSGGRVTVRYSLKDPATKLNKPFIIVEGYDASRVAPLLKEPLDDAEIIKLLSSQTGTYKFSRALDDTAGYDLVFVDFNDGTDHILRNVALVKQVLAWVNSVKATNQNPQDNVVLGMSMGGLVLRYALADLTKQNIPTGTRLLITHDSPHQGANPPMGFQYVTRFIAKSIIGGIHLDALIKIKQGNKLLDEPATSQLAIYKVNSDYTYSINTFLSTTYRNMITFGPNDPQPAYKFIATASGSECGVSTLAPGSTMVHVSSGPVLSWPWINTRPRVTTTLNVKALPNGGAPIKIAELSFTGYIKLYGLIDLPVTYNMLSGYSPQGTLPWDGVPGGTRPVRAEFWDRKLIPFLLIPTSGWVNASYFSYTAVENVCFVPTTSALDLTTVNNDALNAKYIGGISPGNPSRAYTFIAQEGPFTPEGGGASVYNNSHRFFTARNAKWIFYEMEGIIPNDNNCSSACTSSSFVISGDTVLCNSSTYKFDQPALNGTVTWTNSNSTIATLSSNTNNPVTLTAISGQVGYITLSATTTICGQTITKTKQVFVGKPSPPIIAPSVYDAQCGSFAEA